LAVRKITDDDKERRCVVASDEEEKNKSEEQYLLVVAWFSGGGAALITGEGGANSLTMMRKKIDCDGRPGSFYFKMSHPFFYGGVCWTRRSMAWHNVFILLSMVVGVLKMGNIRLLGFF
jgi:hypothetical protein